MAYTIAVAGLLTFAESQLFSARREECFGTDDNYRLFQDFLMRNPRAGDVIPETGGIRKVRWGDPRSGKGKRGGIRIVYLYLEKHDRILMLVAYRKVVVEDLSADVRRTIAAYAASYASEVAAREEQRKRQKGVDAV